MHIWIRNQINSARAEAMDGNLNAAITLICNAVNDLDHVICKPPYVTVPAIDSPSTQAPGAGEVKAGVAEIVSRVQDAARESGAEYAFVVCASDPKRFIRVTWPDLLTLCSAIERLTKEVDTLARSHDSQSAAYGKLHSEYELLKRATTPPAPCATDVEELLTEIMEYADPEGCKADKLLLRAATAILSLASPKPQGPVEAYKIVYPDGLLCLYTPYEAEALPIPKGATVTALRAVPAALGAQSDKT